MKDALLHYSLRYASELLAEVPHKYQITLHRYVGSSSDAHGSCWYRDIAVKSYFACEFFGKEMGNFRNISGSFF